MVGFTRRFDASYRAALSHIRTNALGRPTTLRFQSCEPYDASPFMQSYLSRCGGIFFDSVVHDIDLCLMFLGDSQQQPQGEEEVAIPHQAVAFGHAALHTQLRSPGEHAALRGDADNALGMVQFRSGAVAWFYNSRTAAKGHYDNASEIFCERGKVSVNLVAAKDRCQVADERGVGVGLVEGWYERYKEAFVVETREFVEAVLNGGEVGVPIGSVLVGLRIALALQESLRRGGVVVRFDEKGERVLEEGKGAAAKL
jgi:myo-inositol 2-dehydrogenase / D-chiro-inositol 1-dehydrogenase